MKFTHTASVLRYLRYSLLWLLAGGGYTAVQGQNLVPNGDFELYNACPYTFSSIDYSPSYTSFSYVQDWVRPLDLGTPDYFRGCSTITDASVPKNFAGYQPAHSGVAYAGLIGFYGFDPNPSNSLRELITTKFITPMMKAPTTAPKSVQQQTSDAQKQTADARAQTAGAKAQTETAKKKALESISK